MLTCKQVSRALAEADYMTLSPFRRAMLRMHVAMCAVCGGYNRFVMTFQDAVRILREREETDADDAVHMPKETRLRILDALARDTRDGQGIATSGGDRSGGSA